jgi:hypothetical protein
MLAGRRMASMDYLLLYNYSKSKSFFCGELDGDCSGRR